MVTQNIDVEFQKASEDVKTLTSASNEDLLTLYSLYKQATVGDINTSAPSFWDIKGKAKWDAWNSLKGLSDTEAKTRYIEFVSALKNKN